MTLLKLCGIAALGIVSILIAKAGKSEFAVILSLTIGLIILSVALSEVIPILDFVKEQGQDSRFSPYYTAILKALGIGFIVQITADMARDCGENGIASKLEWAGKIGILLLGLPILRELLLLVQSFIS